MRKILYNLISIGLLLCNLVSAAQAPTVLSSIGQLKKFEGPHVVKKHSHVFSLGIGTPNNLADLFGISPAFNTLGFIQASASDKAGPVLAGYEYFVSDEISLGLAGSYMQATQTFSDATGWILSKPETARLSGYTIGLTTAWHFYTTDHFDPYLSATAGYNFWQLHTKLAIPVILPDPFSYKGLIGLRYFPLKWIGPYGEISYGSSNITAHFGLVLKIN